MLNKKLSFVLKYIIYSKRNINAAIYSGAFCHEKNQCKTLLKIMNENHIRCSKSPPFCSMQIHKRLNKL